MPKPCVTLLLLLASATAIAQSNRIDFIRHDAPELARYGSYAIGVRTLQFTHADQPDILASLDRGERRRYDRQLTVEIWYPARLAPDQQPGVAYTTTTRNPAIVALLQGRAVRDAQVLEGAQAFPLIIISHGYPGNRYLMSHLGENLASKGYVVASIDHPESTYEDQQAFWSTLYFRPIDQLFVLDRLTDLSGDPGSFLNGQVDTQRTGIVGYSMGGYGLLINLGGGYSDTVVNHESAPAQEFAVRHAARNPAFSRQADPRIKAGFAIAPWGMADDIWRPADLETVNVPTFYLSGSADETSGYENGTRALFQSTTAADRYLLTFEYAGHNAIAPIALPAEIAATADQAGASHYTDPVWDSVRSSNIMLHFATAFFDYYLKKDSQRIEYINLIERSDDGVYAVENGEESSLHSYWKGFPPDTARGLRLEHRAAGE